jgi:hypothetical protein
MLAWRTTCWRDHEAPRQISGLIRLAPPGPQNNVAISDWRTAEDRLDYRPDHFMPIHLTAPLRGRRPAMAVHQPHPLRHPSSAHLPQPAILANIAAD